MSDMPQIKAAWLSRDRSPLEHLERDSAGRAVAMKMADRLLAESSRVKAAFDGAVARGLTRAQAKAEIAKALFGCLYEAWHDMPDRADAVMAAIGAGKAAADLFPAALYRERPEGSA